MNSSSRPYDSWSLGFLASLILILICCAISLGLPSPGVKPFISGSVWLFIMYSKIMFGTLMVYVISLVVYGFSNGKPIASGFIDGASISLLLMSYLILLLAGYSIDSIWPLLIQVTIEGKTSLILDWGQIAILTLVLKNKRLIVKILSKSIAR